jgi:hypothetical protein
VTLLFAGTVAVMVLSALYIGVLLAKVKEAEETRGVYPKVARSLLKSLRTVVLSNLEFHILTRAMLPTIE